MLPLLCQTGTSKRDSTSTGYKKNYKKMKELRVHKHILIHKVTT